MTTFIFDVLKDLKDKYSNLSELTFIVPSKRAGLFLKHQLPEIVNQTAFAPSILSIKEFVEQLSQLKSISNTELLFEFYNSYSALTKSAKRDTFETFSKWAQILLQDFNEIDRYLIPQEKVFDYLSAIQDLNHWSLEPQKTDFVKNYLSFWHRLHDYYRHFTQNLLKKQIGYQGLIYREAVENIESYIQSNSEKNHVFLGFNALNTAESSIIQELLQNDMAHIYWDIDSVFFNNKNHDAGLFIRQHKTNWKYFQNHPFHWITDNYSNKKSISMFGVPKNIGQAKHIGSILKNLQTNNSTLQSTAVVLGDENLLIPVLNSIPSNINNLNITMGFPLKSIPLASLFETLFQLHKNGTKKHYYKDVIKIISHQYVKPLFFDDDKDYASHIIETIESNNLVYVSITKLTEITPQFSNILNLLFLSWENSTDYTVNNCSKLILEIKNNLDRNKASNLLSLEYLYRFNALFNEIYRLNSQHQYIKNVSTLHSVYKELLSSETLDFQGEPLQGLQIMGMLESRVLDFETVIISSVNEGILPSGKTQNSFIPFDVKIENKLPTYKEKDAVYTYHFYRLLQRAKNIYILYNTEADVLTGGEKSRFITQLELDNTHNIDHKIIAPKVPIITPNLKRIKKTVALQKELMLLAKRGFSPSSLTNYIRNPIDFYNQSILKIREHNDVEETVAANTLGTVVHNTLEDFYKPLVGIILTEKIITNLKSKIEERVTHHFKNEYKQGDFSTGKNLIIFEIAKRYVTNFINLELQEVKAGNEIKIIAIEANNEIDINIPELNFPVKLKGKVDRVDQYNGLLRIIDYKTGNVASGQVEIVDWEDILTDYKKYSKSFQVLTYAYMMQASKGLIFPIEAGIVSFKNLSSGFLKFAKKESPRSRKKDALITQETLEKFELELKKLIIEICNSDEDFIEKEI
ncbi:PD-(D/E)XK nuclease family protein [Flavobacteriaceae bacterium GSB9]|nr:PD-(D/E)XK nuclease family protein [Flavobacteriaceae bacterium GSB9]